MTLVIHAACKLPRSLFFLSIFLLSLANAQAEDKRPNILWIFVEDLSPWFGCYGHEANKNHTPVLDGLAKRGVLFERAFTTAPVCSASRSAIITGRYQTSNGTHQHRSSRSSEIPVPEAVRIHLPVGQKTLPELLRAAGYDTFNKGKDDYNFHYNRHDLYSWGTRQDYVVGQNGWQGNAAPALRDWNKGMWQDQTDKNRPWFGQLMLWGGKAKDRHVPEADRINPADVTLPAYYPDTPIQRKAWADHINAARGTDRQVGEVLQRLEKDGLLDKTIIFFFSDHGNNSSLRHKQFCYEGGLHVPLIVAGPVTNAKTGTRRPELVSALDISATTLALAGTKIPSYFEGNNLFAKDHQPRTYMISARDRCDYTIDRIRSVRTDQFRYIQNSYPERPLLQPQYRDTWPITKDLKEQKEKGTLTPYQLSYWFESRPPEELYDLAKDPDQLHNLVTDPNYRDQYQKHRQILQNWMQKTGDQGQMAESLIQLEATFELWKDKPIFKDAPKNPEYSPFLNP